MLRTLRPASTYLGYSSLQKHQQGIAFNSVASADIEDVAWHVNGYCSLVYMYSSIYKHLCSFGVSVEQMTNMDWIKACPYLSAWEKGQVVKLNLTDSPTMSLDTSDIVQAYQNEDFPEGKVGDVSSLFIAGQKTLLIILPAKLMVQQKALMLDQPKDNVGHDDIDPGLEGSCVFEPEFVKEQCKAITKVFGMHVLCRHFSWIYARHIAHINPLPS